MEDKKSLENQNGVWDIKLKDGEEIAPETFNEFTNGRGEEPNDEQQQSC